MGASIILAALSVCIILSAIAAAHNPPIVDPVPSPNISGTIDEPMNGGWVIVPFRASGKTKNANKDTHLWLVVLRGTLTWPKVSVTVDENGQWVADQVNEESTSVE